MKAKDVVYYMAGISPALSLDSLFCRPHIAVIKQNTPDTGVVAEVCSLSRSTLVAQHAAAVNVQSYTKVYGTQFPREMQISATLGHGASDLIDHCVGRKKTLQTQTLKSGPRLCGNSDFIEKYPCPVIFCSRLYTWRLRKCGGITVGTYL